MAISWARIYSSSRSSFCKLTSDQVLVSDWIADSYQNQGPIVRRQVDVVFKVKVVSQFCFHYFNGTKNKSCKTLSPSISQGLIHLSCRSEDELVLSLDKRPRKSLTTLLRNKDEFNRLNQTINSRFRNKDRFSQRIIAVGRLDGLVQLTCDRDTFAHVSSTVLHMRTLCVPANLSTRVQWIADL